MIAPDKPEVRYDNTKKGKSQGCVTPAKLSKFNKEIYMV